MFPPRSAADSVLRPRRFVFFVGGQDLGSTLASSSSNDARKIEREGETENERKDRKRESAKSAMASAREKAWSLLTPGVARPLSRESGTSQTFGAKFWHFP